MRRGGEAELPKGGTWKKGGRGPTREIGARGAVLPLPLLPHSFRRLATAATSVALAPRRAARTDDALAAIALASAASRAAVAATAAGAA